MPAFRNKDMPICVLSLENSEVLKSPNAVIVVECSRGSILASAMIYFFFSRRSSTAFHCLVPVSWSLMTFTAK